MNNLKSINVKLDTLDNQLNTANLSTPYFIKIDVERLDFYVLSGMNHILSKYHPALYVEVHGIGCSSKARNVKNIVELLSKYNYSLYHVETEANITINNYEQSCEGHLYAY